MVICPRLCLFLEGVGGVSSLETRCTGCLRSFLRHGDGIAPTNRDRNVQEASCLLLDRSSSITANYYNHRSCLQPQHLGCALLGSPLQQGRDDAGCSGRWEWDGTAAWDDGAWVSCFLPRHALWGLQLGAAAHSHRWILAALAASPSQFHNLSWVSSEVD